MLSFRGDERVFPRESGVYRESMSRGQVLRTTDKTISGVALPEQKWQSSFRLPGVDGQVSGDPGLDAKHGTLDGPSTTGGMPTDARLGGHPGPAAREGRRVLNGPLERPGAPGYLAMSGRTRMNVAQWESSCLPVQQVRIRFLVREDLTSCRAIKPLHSPLSPRSGALGCNKRSRCSENPAHRD